MALGSSAFHSLAQPGTHAHAHGCHDSPHCRDASALAGLCGIPDGAAWLWLHHRIGTARTSLVAHAVGGIAPRHHDVATSPEHRGYDGYRLDEAGIISEEPVSGGLVRVLESLSERVVLRVVYRLAWVTWRGPFAGVMFRADGPRIIHGFDGAPDTASRRVARRLESLARGVRYAGGRPRLIEDGHWRQVGELALAFSRANEKISNDQVAARFQMTPSRWRTLRRELLEEERTLVGPSLLGLTRIED